jgi:hypothetical protein
MARVLRTTDDYRVIVGNGNSITLDTTGGQNDGAGKVVITGDLEVRGDTTTVESTITTIQDNIIILSYVDSNDTRTGLPATTPTRPYSSGLEIDRGQVDAARWIYDDSISWQLGAGQSGTGTWIATRGEDPAEQVLPLATSGIVSSGSANLYISTGTGVITVSGGSVDYEESVFRYEEPTPGAPKVITPDPVTREVIIDSDHIPNAKAVKDYVDYAILDTRFAEMREDDTSVEVIDRNNTIDAILVAGTRTTIRFTGLHGFDVGDSITIQGTNSAPTDANINALTGTWTVLEVITGYSIEINANTSGGDENAYVTNSAYTVDDESTVEVTVSGNVIANFYNNRMNVADIEIVDNQIFVTDSNQDLILSAPGTGSVKVNDVLELPKTPSDDDAQLDPQAPDEGIKLYSKSPSTGKTGLFYINEESVQDEIVSKNRALLYGMLF